MSIDRETQGSFEFMNSNEEVSPEMQSPAVQPAVEVPKANYEPEAIEVDIHEVRDAARRFRLGNTEQPIGKLYVRKSPLNSDKLEFGYYSPTTLKNGDKHRELPREKENRFELMYLGNYDSNGDRIEEEPDHPWRR